MSHSNMIILLKLMFRIIQCLMINIIWLCTLCELLDSHRDLKTDEDRCARGYTEKVETMRVKQSHCARFSKRPTSEHKKCRANSTCSVVEYGRQSPTKHSFVHKLSDSELNCRLLSPRMDDLIRSTGTRNLTSAKRSKRLLMPTFDWRYFATILQKMG